MGLAPGTSIGHYDVTALLGEGGMGQVWQATDTQLNRQVALKIIPDAFAGDPGRFGRFTREAQILAKLNHPNIAAIYGIEESEGTRALVLELVEGPTLADRIAKGPIPLDEALPIAKQIAEALEAAHEAGVIHRDLKPANIKVRQDGTVKVLDFGLAKALEGTGGDPSESPTLTAAATATGVIMGTAAYMSPEQAKGKVVDKRTDIWAFACVLYEMLTGRRAFAGDSVSETVAAVLTADVDFDALPTDVPPAGRRLLRRCFERDPRKRLRDVAEGLLQFEEDVENRTGTTASSVTAPPRIPAARRPLPLLSGIAVASVVTGLAVSYLRPAPPLARDALAVTLPADVSLPGDVHIVFTLSPDGRSLVYVGRSDTTTQLFHRPLDRVEAVPIADTEGAESPFFSPDGEWIGFKLGDTIKRVPLAGGPSVKVCDLPDNPMGDRFRFGMAWGEDDSIWFGHSNTGLYRVAAVGGVPELMTTPGAANEGVTGHFAPQPLPGGRAILYTANRGLGRVHVALYILESGEHRLLAEGGRSWFASSGHVVFSVRVGGVATLWALPFDLDRLEATSDPIPVREGVQAARSTQAYLGADGTLVYLPDTGSTPLQTLVWVSRDGNEEAIDVTPRTSYYTPQLSPDGTRVVVAAREAGRRYDIWIHDLIRGFDMRITDDPGTDWIPMWSLDSRRIFFACGAAYSGLCWQAADGTGRAELLLSDPERGFFPTSWSRDGRSLLGSDWDVDGPTGFNIGIVTMDGEHRRVPLVQTDYYEGSPQVSPDGRWLAYHSNISGRFEIYVSPFPDVGSDRITVSTDGGYHPVWGPHSRELFYRKGIDCGEASREPPGLANDTQDAFLVGCQKAMMAVAVETEPTFTPGIPEVLFEDPYKTGTARHFDIADDGRFLMIKDLPASPREIIVVRNWVEELKERVPVP